MKKIFFLFIITCLYFAAHAQEELNKSESEIRDLSNDFQVEENSDSTTEDGVYKTLIYSNQSTDDENNHNKGVWEYVLLNDTCIVTYFYPVDNATDVAERDYLDSTETKAGQDLWNDDDDLGITIVHQIMDDKSTRYLFMIF